MPSAAHPPPAMFRPFMDTVLMARAERPFGLAAVVFVSMPVAPVLMVVVALAAAVVSVVAVTMLPVAMPAMAAPVTASAVPVIREFLLEFQDDFDQEFAKLLLFGGRERGEEGIGHIPASFPDAFKFGLALFRHGDDAASFVLFIPGPFDEASAFQFGEQFAEGRGPDVKAFEQITLVHGLFFAKDGQNVQLRMVRVSVVVVRAGHEADGAVEQRRQGFTGHVGDAGGVFACKDASGVLGRIVSVHGNLRY